MNDQPTVMGLRASCPSFHYRIAEYVERLADTAHEAMLTDGAPINNRPHVQALRDFASFMRGLGVDDQSLRALSCLQGATLQSRYEPGPNAVSLLHRIASWGTGSAPPNDELLRELVAQAAADSVARHNEARARDTAQVDQARAATKEIETERSLRNAAEERGDRLHDEVTAVSQRNAQLTAQVEFFRNAMGDDQAIEEAVRQTGATHKQARRVAVRGHTGVYTLPSRPGELEIGWPDNGRTRWEVLGAVGLTEAEKVRAARIAEAKTEVTV